MLPCVINAATSQDPISRYLPQLFPQATRDFARGAHMIDVVRGRDLFAPLADASACARSTCTALVAPVVVAIQAAHSPPQLQADITFSGTPSQGPTAVPPSRRGDRRGLHARLRRWMNSGLGTAV